MKTNLKQQNPSRKREVQATIRPKEEAEEDDDESKKENIFKTAVDHIDEEKQSTLRTDNITELKRESFEEANCDVTNDQVFCNPITWTVGCDQDPDDDDVDHHDRSNSAGTTNADGADTQIISSSRESHYRMPNRQQVKFTDAQLESLSNLINIIKDGNINEFNKVLERREFKGNLLNVFVDGHTALHYSLLYGRSLSWCKQLVSNGANPNLTNLAGWHPIHLAAFNGSRETMCYLIDCESN